MGCGGPDWQECMGFVPEGLVYFALAIGFFGGMAAMSTIWALAERQRRKGGAQ